MTEQTNPAIPVTIDPDLKELIPDYLSQRAHNLAALKRAVDAGDFGTIKTLGHKMKGTGKGYGFDAISQLGQTLEQAAQERNAEQVQQAIQSLEDYLSRVVIRYQ